MKKELAIVGFLLLAAIFLFIDFNRLVEILSTANPILFIAAVLVGIPSVTARSAKWHLMLKKQGHRFSFPKILKYYFIGIGLGTFTPGRLGDFVKALFVNRKIRSLGQSFSSVLVDRIIDLIVLLALGILSSLAFIYLYGVTIISIPLIAVLVAVPCIGFYLLFNKKLLKKVLRPFYRALVPEQYKEKLKAGFDPFLSSAQSLLKNRNLLAFAIFFSLVSWGLETLTQFLLAMSLGIELSLTFILMVMSLSTLVSLLPLSVSGIGTRDALLILLFSLQAIPAEQAVAFSFLVLFVSVILSLIGIALTATEKLSFKELLGEKHGAR